MKAPGRGCALSFLVAAALVLAAGCGPKYTYPAVKVPSSVEEICKKEYKLDVTSRVVGKTVGAMIQVADLIDAKGQIPKEVHEKIGKVMQVVTRVALSSDLTAEFCVVVIRDSAHATELVITRAVEDSKRANAEAIGIEESLNRTLFGQSRYQKGLDPLNDGRKDFVLKEVKIENFLAEQIAQRVRFGLTKTAKASKAKPEKKSGEDPEASENPLTLVDGAFLTDHGQRVFRFSILSLKPDGSKSALMEVFKTASEVFGGYRFTGFDRLEVQDYLNRRKLTVTREVLADYQDHKIKDEDILKNYVVETQSIWEAFKMFGIDLPQDGKKRSPSAAVPPA